jgi:UDP-glucose 4-epimerase
MVKNWLITGGCGFIGRNLIRNLMEEGGHFVRIIDNLSVGTREDLAAVCDFKETSVAVDNEAHLQRGVAGGAELIVGDILDEKLAERVAAGIDVIVHLAANTGVAPSVKNPRMDCVTNVIGTLNYLEAARFNKVKRLIFASSGAPAGECVPPIHEELPPHPVSPYGASKLAGEGYCSAYYRTFGIETVALRFSNVYGPLSGHKNSVVAKFIRQAMHGETLEIYGDGRQTRDFLYIDDLVRAVRLAAEVDGIGGQAFQIATNAETTLLELVELLVPLLKQAGVAEVSMHHASPQVGDVMRNFADTTKARSLLGWRTEVALSDGLKKTIDWFREGGK